MSSFGDELEKLALMGLGAPSSMGGGRWIGRRVAATAAKAVAKPPPLPKPVLLHPSAVQEVGSKDYLHAAVRAPKGSLQRKQALQHGSRQFLNKMAAFADEVEKLGFDWGKFREGVVDEGIPLGGATIGAALGHRNPLRGAALGYAGGSAASLAREQLKPKEKRKAMPLSRKILAGSGLGYGAGGLAHAALASRAAGKAGKSIFKGHGMAQAAAEEALPAAGATLGTGIAMGTHKGKDKHAAINLSLGGSWGGGAATLKSIKAGTKATTAARATAAKAAARAAKPPKPKPAKPGKPGPLARAASSFAPAATLTAGGIGLGGLHVASTGDR